MRRLISLAAFFGMVVYARSIAASEPLQNVELSLKACDASPITEASASVVEFPDFIERRPTQHFVRGAGGPKLILSLSPGYYTMYVSAARCFRELRVYIISGFDRHVTAQLYPHGTLWDATEAVGGRLPAGITKATLYSLNELDTIEATIDDGAYYADQTRLDGRYYILVLESRHASKEAHLAIDLSNLRPGGSQRDDISDGDYRVALGHSTSPFSHPTKIIQGPDHAMWFLNPTGNSLGRVSADGSLRIFQLPTFASVPADIAANDSAVWVTEFNVDKIARVTPDGRVNEFAFPASLPLQPGDGRTYRGVEYMAAGSDGRIWFSERFNPAIGAIDRNGVISEYPIAGIFAFSCCLVRGVDDRIWLLTHEPYTGPSALLAVSKDGSAQQFPLDGDFDAMVAASDGVWIGGSVGSERTTQVIHVDVVGAKKVYNTPLQQAVPRHLVDVANGSVLFTDPEGNTIGKVFAEGAIRQAYKPEGITDLLVGPDGSLWYAAPKLGLVVRNLTGDLTGVPAQFYDIRPRPADPTQLALDLEGNVWFTEFEGNAVGVIRASRKVEIYPLPVSK